MENSYRQKEWSEFQEAGMFWFINRILHVFGWVIVHETDDEDKIIRVYPARTKCRGFIAKLEDNGFRQVTKYMKENIDILDQECPK